MSNTEYLLNQNLWIPSESDAAKQAKLALQYNAAQRGYQNRVQTVRLYSERDGYVVVPRHYLDYSSISVKWTGPDEYPILNAKCSIKPYGNTPAEEKVQQEAFDFLANYKPWPAEMDATVCLRCGGGKTCIGLRGAFDLGYQFIVVAHTKDILSNWREELERYTDARNIGEIVSGKVNIQPVTLALVQSLVALPTEQIEEIQTQFGTVLFDEMHHYASRDFSVVANAFSGRRIGLSATVTREDGLSFVTNLSLGSSLFFREIIRKKADVFFKRVRVTDIDYPDNYALAVSTLASSNQYLDAIVADIREGYRDQQKQLVVSSRKDLLYALKERLADLDPGVNTSETKADERHRNLRTKRILLAVDAIAKEGLNEPSLTQARVLTPVKDPNALVQMVGRLERGSTVMQAFFYSADYVPFLRTLHKAKDALVRHQYRVKEGI